MRKSWLAPLVVLWACGICRPAAAQFAVIDVASIAQLVQQYQTLTQQLATAQAHLEQAQRAYAAITGGRGMEQLLAGTNRNYLPANWTDVAAALSGSGGTYAALGASVQSLVTSNATLNAQALGRLSSTELTHLDTDRRNAALLQALTRQALTTTSSRFAALQQLISAIPTATDSKGALDLQARINAEQTMLANEGAKLQTLYQLVQAEEAAEAQRRREQALSDLGSLRALAPLGLH